MSLCGETPDDDGLENSEEQEKLTKFKQQQEERGAIVSQLKIKNILELSQKDKDIVA